MGEMEDLVRRLKGHGEPQTVAEHWQRALDAWKADVTKLVADMKRWLEPGRQEGVFFIKDLEVEIREEDLGQYTVPGLEVTLLAGEALGIRVVPRGLRIVGVVAFGAGRVHGAKGRVDLVSGPARALLLRFTDGGTRWRLLRSTGNPSDLNEDDFARVLDELVA